MIDSSWKASESVGADGREDSWETDQRSGRLFGRRSGASIGLGDSVKVNRSTLARASDAINAVSQPLGGLVQIWTLFRLINTN